MKAWRFLVHGSFALWFGGFTFYAGFVVPIGSEVQGSERAQGFITREVTSVLNVLGAIALALLLVHVFVLRSGAAGRLARASLLLAAALQVGLFVAHPWLDALLDAGARDVVDPAAFYQRHRVYLWLSALLWLCMLHQLWELAVASRRDSDPPAMNTRPPAEKG